MKILMLCLGNICRSPTAESILRKKAMERKLDLFTDSAGTSGYHQGEASDSRSIHHAEKRGYAMTHRARQLTLSDFENFDLILAMDASNAVNARKLTKKSEHLQKIKLIGEFSKQRKIHEIPDPYYGQAADFELVIDLLEACIEGLLAHYQP